MKRTVKDPRDDKRTISVEEEKRIVEAYLWELELAELMSK